MSSQTQVLQFYDRLCVYNTIDHKDGIKQDLSAFTKKSDLYLSRTQMFPISK